MKISKSIFIACVAITTIATVFGQPSAKTEKKNSFRNKVNNPTSVGKAVSSNDYSFSTTTGTYENLIGAVSINNNQLWDDPEYTIPIGFNFQLYNSTLDSVYFGSGEGGLVSSKRDSDSKADYLIIPFETDLIDRGDISEISQSPISYKLVGSAGNRILKIEWKNAGFFDEEGSELNDYINFQLWLYEGSNNIEIHFGANKITNSSLNYFGETGAVIGLSDSDQSNTYLLSESPSNPTMTDESIAYLNGTPPDGTVYKFSKNSTGINFNESNNYDVRVYPNPFHQYATFKVNNSNIHHAELKVIDIFGRVIKTIDNIQTNEITLNRDNLVNGIYFYQLTEKAKTIATGKFIVE